MEGLVDAQAGDVAEAANVEGEPEHKAPDTHLKDDEQQDQAVDGESDLEQHDGVEGQDVGAVFIHSLFPAHVELGRAQEGGFDSQ